MKKRGRKKKCKEVKKIYYVLLGRLEGEKLLGRLRKGIIAGKRQDATSCYGEGRNRKWKNNKLEDGNITLDGKRLTMKKKERKEGRGGKEMRTEYQKLFARGEKESSEIAISSCTVIN